jgi:lysophospholipase
VTEVSSKTDPRTRRVAVLYTGGTIGMREGPRGFEPVRGYLSDVLRGMPQFHDPGQPALTTPASRLGTRVRYDVIEAEEPLDSSNMTKEDWVRIARAIESRYDAYDGFVVLHGTDTMAYTASALSFMFDNLRKTVVVTGSQIPLSQTRSDAIENLLGALLIAGHFVIPEVGLYFRNRLYRGNRARKVDAAGFDAFDSTNYPALAEVGIDMQVRWEHVRVAPRGPLQVVPITNANVADLRLFPGLGTDALRNFLRPPMQGLVIETYGAGNAPDNRPDFLTALREATDAGLVIVNVTQCHRGAVTDDYAAGRALRDAGVIPCADMTPEAALTKLAWLLSQQLSPAQVAERMAKPARGEMTVASGTRLSFLERDFVSDVARVLADAAHPQERSSIERALYPVLMCSAAAHGDIDAIERMLAEGVDPSVADYDGRTPLHVGAARGHEGVCDLLIARGVPLEARDGRGDTPLVLAIRAGSAATAALLRLKGARLDAATVERERARAKGDDRAEVLALLGGG